MSKMTRIVGLACPVFNYIGWLGTCRVVFVEALKCVLVLAESTQGQLIDLHQRVKLQLMPAFPANEGSCNAASLPDMCHLLTPLVLMPLYHSNTVKTGF